jgi:hypothetical protein
MNRCRISDPPVWVQTFLDRSSMKNKGGFPTIPL